MDTDLRQDKSAKGDKGVEPHDLDIASMVKAATDRSGSISVGRFNQDLHTAVQGALDAGRSVTLFADDRASNIVAIDRGMLRDEQGQRWGAMALMSDPDGKLGNRLTIGAAEAQRPERSTSAQPGLEARAQAEPDRTEERINSPAAFPRIPIGPSTPLRGYSVGTLDLAAAETLDWARTQMPKGGDPVQFAIEALRDDIKQGRFSDEKGVYSQDLLNHLQRDGLRAEARAHVGHVRSWGHEEATLHAAADLTAYHTPRASRTGDADSMQHLREDMALRARNSEPYRSELQRLDPNTLREVLAQPIASRSRSGQEPADEREPARRAARDTASPTLQQGSPPAKEEASRAAGTSENIVSAVSGAKRAIDSELDAQQREAAKASISPNDRQAAAKREVIDHMTPEELRRFAAAGADKPKAEQVLRDAAAREERAAATGAVREPVPPLAERFNISRRLFTKEYEFRDQPGKIAFSERFNTLRSSHSTPIAAIAMIDRAGERGWSTVRVTGAAEFMRQAWIAAEARGIKAIGYEPTKGDIEAARAERERLGKTALWQGGAVERASDRVPERAPQRTPDQRRDRAADLASERSAGRGAEAQGSREAGPSKQAHQQLQPQQQPQQQPSRQAGETRTDETRSPTAAEPVKREDAPRSAGTTADIPSFAGPNAQPDDKGAQRDDKTAERDAGQRQQAQRPDGERQRGDRDDKREVDQAIGRGIGSVAFMRALEQVMDRDGVPQERRPEIRNIAQQQFAALRAEGKTVRVPLVDRAAPRRTPVHLPHYDVKRAAQERTR